MIGREAHCESDGRSGVHLNFSTRRHFAITTPFRVEAGDLQRVAQLHVIWQVGAHS